MTKDEAFDIGTPLGCVNTTLAVYSQELLNIGAGTVPDILVLQETVQKKVLQILAGTAELSVVKSPVVH